jgi:NTP pyrophosphatase (non-canonical NTP hydrolase)
MRTLNEWAKECHFTARVHEFWDVEEHYYVFPAKIALIMSELGEAIEEDRKGNPIGVKEELADSIIRIFDLCGYMNIDIDSAVRDKMSANYNRPVKHNKRY